jgi:hypothetical protein
MAGLLDFEELQQNPLRMGLLMAGLNMMGGKNGVQDGAQGFAQGLLHANQYKRTKIQDDRLRHQMEREQQQMQRQMQNDSLDQQYKRLQMDKLQNPQNFVDPYNTVVETSQGLYSFNNRSGQLTPLMSGNNQPLMRSTSDPFQQAQITAAKEGQKGVKATDPEGREFYARQSDVNPGAFRDLLSGLINTESGGNPNAVSPMGARGLTQIMPETARDPGFGVRPMVDNSVDEQLRFGSDYLRALIKHYGGDVQKALSAYNAGPGNVDKNGITNPGYVSRVMGGPVMGPSLQDRAAVDVQKAGQSAAAEMTAKSGAQAQIDLPKVEESANTMLSLINRLESHPGLGYAVGTSSVLPVIPGTAAADFTAMLDQTQGKVFLQAYDALKGGGQITEAEGRKAEQAIARLSRGQTEEGFRSALQDLKSVVLNAREAAKRKAGIGGVGGASGGWQQAPMQPQLPSGNIKFLGFE